MHFILFFTGCINKFWAGIDEKNLTKKFDERNLTKKSDKKI